MENNSNLIYNENILNISSPPRNQILYQTYTNLNPKEKKYKSIQDKINELQNINLKNPNRITSLEYNINKINNDMKRTISNYIEKSKYLEKTLQSLQTLNESRKQIQENNKKKYEKELETIYLDMQNRINEHKNFMVERINNDFINIENRLMQVIEKKKEINNEIYQQIEKLKNIAENEIPRLYDESNDLNYKNKNNIEVMQNMLNEEVNYTKNLIVNNSQKIKENEDNFNIEINNQMDIVYNDLNNIKKSRKKNEEEMLEQISDFVKKIKEAIA